MLPFRNVVASWPVSCFYATEMQKLHKDTQIKDLLTQLVVVIIIIVAVLGSCQVYSK